MDRCMFKEHQKLIGEGALRHDYSLVSDAHADYYTHR
jgi:hypothetical protein